MSEPIGEKRLAEIRAMADPPTSMRDKAILELLDEVDRMTAIALELFVDNARLSANVNALQPILQAAIAWRGDPAKGFGSIKEHALSEAITAFLEET